MPRIRGAGSATKRSAGWVGGTPGRIRNGGWGTRLGYLGAGVGIASGGYAWHNRHTSDQANSSPGPYYY